MTAQSRALTGHFGKLLRLGSQGYKVEKSLASTYMEYLTLMMEVFDFASSFQYCHPADY